MTLGEKLKETRIAHGLTQEELANRLCVSRQAIAKWESNRGLPDIANLKAISKTLEISIDYLLDDENEDAVSLIVREPIDLEKYPKATDSRLKDDFVVLDKYPNATNIIQVFRRRRLTKLEWILDIFTVPGIFDVADQFKDPSAYYYVENDGKIYLVNVTKELIISKRLVRHMPVPKSGKKFYIGDQSFMFAARNIKNGKNRKPV